MADIHILSHDESGGIGHNRPPGDDTQSPACPRIAVKKVRHLLPDKFLTQLELNEKIADCCRRPIEHDIEALYSSRADKARGVPDIYILTCTCGRKHRRFCVGGSMNSGAATEPRPFWTVR